MHQWNSSNNKRHKLMNIYLIGYRSHIADMNATAIAASTRKFRQKNSVFLDGITIIYHVQLICFIPMGQSGQPTICVSFPHTRCACRTYLHVCVMWRKLDVDLTICQNLMGLSARTELNVWLFKYINTFSAQPLKFVCTILAKLIAVSRIGQPLIEAINDRYTNVYCRYC